MARKRFLVERRGEAWKVTADDGAAFGTFNDMETAATYAIDVAYRAGPAHRDGTQVLLQRLDNTYRIAWTFGIDPYPSQYRVRKFRWPGAPLEIDDE